MSAVIATDKVTKRNHRLNYNLNHNQRLNLNHRLPDRHADSHRDPHADHQTEKCGDDGTVDLADPTRDQAERFRRGDDCALRYAYDRFGPAIYRLARGGLPTAADAEEVTQATLVAAWLGRSTYNPDRGSLLGWLLSIARRQVIDRLRARAREQRVTETVEAHSPNPAPTGDPNHVLDRLVIADCLARLPSQQRRILELTFFDDLTNQQVSAHTGIPLGTVKSHLRRGMANLRQGCERGEAGLTEALGE